MSFSIYPDKKLSLTEKIILIIIAILLPVVLMFIPFLIPIVLVLFPIILPILIIYIIFFPQS
jgi:hypothetical protein